MEYKPLVSIIIPVYNGDLYLKEAIQSCLNQTYSNIEIIVVNDGSTDGGKSAQIAKEFEGQIRYFEKENGGVSSALNYGISKMRGEWFSWLSHDDLYLPEKIEKQINAVQEYPNKVCVIRCSTSSINQYGYPIFRPQRKIQGYFTAERMMYMHSIGEVGLYGCSLLIHRNILRDCGEFDLSLRMVQDEDYWNRIMFKGYPFISISESLVRIRIHQGQTTNLLSNRFSGEREIMIQKAIAYYKENETLNFSLLYTLAKKQALEHRYIPYKMLLKEICRNSKFGVLQNIVLQCYMLYGYIYASLKIFYRNIVVKRNRRI